MEEGKLCIHIIAIVFYLFHALYSLNKLGYNLPLEEMFLVHPHWLEYQAPPYFLHILLAMIYIILMVTSITGNGIVIWIFST